MNDIFDHNTSRQEINIAENVSEFEEPIAEKIADAKEDLNDVLSEKVGAKKLDHPDEFRPEAPSFPDDQRSQPTLPQDIEKIPNDVLSEKVGAKKLDHPDEFRPEAPSFPENPDSQLTLPQDIEKIPNDNQKDLKKTKEIGIEDISDLDESIAKNTKEDESGENGYIECVKENALDNNTEKNDKQENMEIIGEVLVNNIIGLIDNTNENIEKLKESIGGFHKYIESDRVSFPFDIGEIDKYKDVRDEIAAEVSELWEDITGKLDEAGEEAPELWETITDKLKVAKRKRAEEASAREKDPTEKLKVTKRERAENTANPEENLAQKPAVSKTDVPPASKQRTKAHKLEPNSRFSFLREVAGFLQRRLRRKVPPVLQLTAIECGAACLAMILSYYGRQTRVAEIRDHYGIGRDGLSALDIVKAARHYGMRVRAISIRGQIDELRFVNFPAIVYWEFNHFMVLERWSAKYVDVVDPAVGRKRLSREEFELGFTGVVIVMEPGEQFNRHTSSIRKLTLRSYAAQYVKRAPMTLVQLIAASLCLQIFGLGVPILTKVIIDQIIPLKLTSFVPLLGIIVLSLLLAQVFVLVLRSLLLIYLQCRIDMYIYPSFFDHMFMLPLKFFQQRSTGDILTRVSSNNTIRDIVSSQFLSTILDGSLLVVYMLILFWQSWLFALIVLTLGILQFALLLGTNHEYRLRSARELEAIGKSQGYVAEILGGMTTVKAAGAEQRVFQRWSNLFYDQLNSSVRRSYLASFLSTSITIMRIISPLVLLWLGVIQVLNGTMQLGTMIALNSLAAVFVSPLASLASSATQLPIIRSHLERISDVMEAEVEQEVQQAQEPPQLTGRIQLQNVGFKYDANSSAILKEITIDIAPGQKIAIVGPTGSGKSTLGKLLLGLYLPTQGEILYDGIPLHSLSYQSVRSQFGVIMQDARIFSGSIWQNIAFNNPGMDMESIIKAATLAALDGDIQKMPMGYETYVAEAGNTLSGGQRQRLAIARALAHHPSILLLDEATSALDVITERIIEQNLKSLACTQIIIAHRLSTVRDADMILVLNQGSIVESGSHTQLLELGGYYAELIQNQLTIT